MTFGGEKVSIEKKMKSEKQNPAVLEKRETSASMKFSVNYGFWHSSRHGRQNQVFPQKRFRSMVELFGSAQTKIARTVYIEMKKLIYLFVYINSHDS